MEKGLARFHKNMGDKMEEAKRSASDPRSNLGIYKAKGDVKIDGNLSESAWNVKKISEFYNNVNGKPINYKTEMTLLQYSLHY